MKKSLLAALAVTVAGGAAAGGGLVGFGQDGPYAAKPAYDDLIQGASGVPALVAAASDGTPRYVPVNIADRVVGLFAVQAKSTLVTLFGVDVPWWLIAVVAIVQVVVLVLLAPVVRRATAVSAVRER